MTLGSACSFSLIQCCVRMLQMKAIVHQENQEGRCRLSPSPTLKNTQRNLTVICQIFRCSLFQHHQITSFQPGSKCRWGGKETVGGLVLKTTHDAIKAWKILLNYYLSLSHTSLFFFFAFFCFLLLPLHYFRNLFLFYFVLNKCYSIRLSL